MAQQEKTQEAEIQGAVAPPLEIGLKLKISTGIYKL